MNGILKQAIGAAGGAVRLGTWPLRAALGLLGNGDSDSARVEAAATPLRPRSARKPPTRPPSRARRTAPRRSSSPRATKPLAAVSDE